MHPKNIVWNKPVTIYTTTPTHNSHVIIHFNLQQTFHTRLIWSKNRLYQVVSFFLVESEKIQFKPKFQVHLVMYTLYMLYHHKRNQIFLLFTSDIENFIKYFILRSNIPELARNCFKFLHAPAQVASYLFLHDLQVLSN